VAIIGTVFTRRISRIKKLFRKYKKFFLFVGIGFILAIMILNVCLVSNFYQKSDHIPEICVRDQNYQSTTVTDPKITEFGLKIEKLDIVAPIIKDVDGKSKSDYNNALKEGIAHFKGTSLPGGGGNIFIFGHSSAQTKSDYSKIFATLDDLEENDEIIIYYKNKENRYNVKEKTVVEATDLSVLEQGEKEILTLMTCWPVGTKDKRLIIRAGPAEK